MRQVDVHRSQRGPLRRLWCADEGELLQLGHRRNYFGWTVDVANSPTRHRMTLAKPIDHDGLFIEECWRNKRFVVLEATVDFVGYERYAFVCR